MLTRPLHNRSTYLGESEADQIARQFAGSERLTIPDCYYASSPGQVAMTATIPHPDGGNAVAPGLVPTGSLVGSRTW